MTSLSEDAKIVRECGLNVRVAKRDAQGARWETVAELHDLEEAVAVAAEVDARQLAVFVGGYFYWTSDDPDLFNSDDLSHASARPVRMARGCDFRSHRCALHARGAQDRRYVMRRLRELGDLFSTGSWRMLIDAPRELGFASYIGRVECFSLDDGLSPSSETEAEWRGWRDNLPRNTQEGRSEIDRALHDLRAGSLPSGRPTGLCFDPPLTSLISPTFRTYGSCVAATGAAFRTSGSR